ncbi:MAG TPA: aminomethyl transferase family protein [Calditrichaeota bacterium]|nr:aminomethyl transferase family protein [Calditrichota bacterium]
MKKLILHDFHERQGARFKTVNNWLIPAVYVKLALELEAPHSKFALLDRSYLGKVILRGRDALDLLNRISTNDMSELIVGTVCDTVFTTPKGRIVDYCRVLHLEDSLLIVSSYMDAAHLIDWISRFIILDDVEIEDATGRFLWLTLIGPDSLRFVRSISHKRVVQDDEQIWIEHRGVLFPALLNENFLVNAYNICLPVDTGEIIFGWLFQQLLNNGGTLMGDEAFQVIRIESGMPDWGTELNENHNPHEARLLKAVSFTKECYTGQEVIARLDTYDKVQRYLMIIEMDDRVDGQLPLDIYLENDKIGTLTSYADDPLRKRHIGLAYINKQYAIEDYNLQVEVQTAQKRIPSVLRKPSTGI